MLYAGAGPLRVGARATDSGVRIWVEDEGPGIPVGEHEAVFEKFYASPAAGHEGALRHRARPGHRARDRAGSRRQHPRRGRRAPRRALRGRSAEPRRRARGGADRTARRSAALPRADDLAPTIWRRRSGADDPALGPLTNLSRSSPKASLLRNAGPGTPALSFEFVVRLGKRWQAPEGFGAAATPRAVEVVEMKSLMQGLSAANAIPADRRSHLIAPSSFPIVPPAARREAPESHSLRRAA